MALFGSSWDDPQTQAILALGAGLLGGGSFGQSLGRGATGAMQAYQQAMQAKQEQAREEQRRQMAEMQMQEQRAAMQEREQARAQQKQLQSIYQQSFAPQTDGADFMRNAMAGDLTTPSASRQPNIQQGLQSAQQAMMAQGFIPEALGLQKQLAEFTPQKKVKDWKPLMVGGVQKMVPLFEDGSVGSPTDYEQPVELKFQDAGGRIVGLNPYTADQVGGAVQKTNSPDSLLSANVTMRGQNMTDARSRENNSIQGDLRTLQAQKLGMELRDSVQGKETAAANLDTAMGTLRRLVGDESGMDAKSKMPHKGFEAAVGAKNPFLGSFGWATVPGTSAADFNAELEAFKSQTFLPVVQQLRGMGALTEKEGERAIASVGALNPSMSEEEFKASAKRIMQDLANAKLRMGAGSSGLNLPNKNWDSTKPSSQGIKFLGFE